MGDRNHLHVCRHCGNVTATTSETPPRTRFNCEENNVSIYLAVPDGRKAVGDGVRRLR